ncbi:MAG: hypothetical protein WC712_00990 [Candidatus Brocadiia bacterium]
MKTEDEIAIEKTLSGEASAFGDIVTRHRFAVMRLCLFVCGEHDTASNMVKRAFLAFANNIVQFRAKGDMHPFLVDAAAREILLWAKRGSPPVSRIEDNKQKLVDSFFIPADGMANLEGRSVQEFRDYCIRVTEALTKIPSLTKLVVALKLFETRSFNSIALVLSIPETEVREHVDLFRKSVLGAN